MEQVLKGELWSFHKHIVALKRVRPHTDISSLMFETISMWIQVHNLPFGLPSSVANSIVFEVWEVDENTRGDEMFEGCNFLRIRVGVEVSKLTHMDRKCPIWLKNKSSLKEADHQFGLWMRAATSNLAQRTMVRVTRFEEDDSGY